MKMKEYDIKKHITLSKEKTYIKSYDAVQETDLIKEEKMLLNFLLSFGEKNQKITPSIEYFSKRLGLDVKTVRLALRNFQIRGLVKVNREPGKANEIILNKEYINRFLGCVIFPSERENNKNKGAADASSPMVNRGGLPSVEEINKYQRI